MAEKVGGGEGRRGWQGKRANSSGGLGYAGMAETAPPPTSDRCARVQQPYREFDKVFENFRICGELNHIFPL